MLDLQWHDGSMGVRARGQRIALSIALNVFKEGHSPSYGVFLRTGHVLLFPEQSSLDFSQDSKIHF